MRKVIYCLVFAFSFLALACQKEDPEADIHGIITLSKESLEFDATGPTLKIILNVSSTFQWTATVDQSWVDLSRQSGEGSTDYKMTVEVKPNNHQESRTATITFKSGATVKELPVIQKQGAMIIDPSQVKDYDKIYVPSDQKSHGFLDSSKQWFFGRSAQSEHFILFWEKDYGEYGDTTPKDAPKPFTVDVDALLDWAEKCFDYYCNTLRFVDHGQGKSYTDKYKMHIRLVHSTTWKAEGFGVDDVIGVLAVNPDAAVDKSTLAHEIGHIFQYQVYCDQVLNHEVSNSFHSGWRYEIGSIGCGFWEQTSQWQSFLMCPDQALNNWYFAGSTQETTDGEDLGCFVTNCHRHFLHEVMRYSSYFFHYYITDKYGMDALGRLWRGSRYPDDALQAYKKVFGVSQEELNRDIYNYAAKCVTWDFKDLAEDGLKHLDQIRWKSIKGADGFYKVADSRSPEATGFNVIKLKSVKAGKDVSIDFEGLSTKTDAGWTIGFVGLDKNNRRHYSEPLTINKAGDLKGTTTWTVPEGCTKVWAVVACTPDKYYSHGWDNNLANDTTWPYQIKVSGASL